MKTEVEIPVMRVMAIRRESPAWKLIIEAVPLRPGLLIPCTDEQYESLLKDCVILDIPTKAPDRSYSPYDSIDRPEPEGR